MHSRPLIRLTGASVVARTHDGDRVILSDVNLSVGAGERVVVLGANGAGKSTLLKLCNGIVAASTGAVETVAMDRQALIFQRTPLLRRSVIDNVRFVLHARGVSKADSTGLAARALEACALAGVSAQLATSLSGGEQQRLALARAWACSPQLLLADEPTANLAPASTREVERLLLALFEIVDTAVETRRSLMLTTHNVAQARRIASRIVFLDDGRVVEDRPADEFFSDPRSVAARAYLEGESV